MAEKINVPEIRFAGFIDPWEQRKLGELTTILSAVRVHKEEWRTAGVPFYRSSDVMAAFKGTENERVFISQELFEQLSAQSGAPQKGDVMVTGGGSVGTPYIVPDNKPLYTKDADLIWIKRHTEINPKFLYSFFISPIFKSYIRSISHVGTIAHYTIEQVKETPLLMPCSIVEQKAIGSFLGNLDSLITLHQRKFEKLVQLKKSMLDKMFPKPGERFPEIRFAGFTDPWEQRKLGEFGSVAMCKRIYKEQTSEQGDVPFFKIGTFGADPDAFISNELFEDFKRTYPYPAPGTLLISAAGSIGRIVEYQGEKAYFQDSNIVWLEHDHRLNDAFLKPLYSQIEWGLEGSTIKRLYNKDLLSAEVTIPDDREQKVIGQFFAKLDNLITLHQRKLELLRNTKKSLLDRMFV